MSAAYGADPETNHYYRCLARCLAKQGIRGGSYVPVSIIDAAFAPMLLTRLVELREEISKGSAPAPSPKSANITERRAKLQRKRERHLENYADDLMTKEELRAALSKIDQEMLGLAAEEAREPKPLSSTVRREMLQEVSTIEKAWMRADGKTRRQLVNLLAERVAIANGQPPVPTWREKEALSAGIRS